MTCLILQVLGCDANSLYMRDLLFIHDIFQKVTKLKLVTSSTTVEVSAKCTLYRIAW